MVAFTFLTVAATAITGALATPRAEADPDGPNFEIGPHNLARRQGGLDYNQNWKAGQGNINYQAQSNGYSVTFSNAGDFVVGKGWRTGKARNISFEGSTQQQAGTVLVSVYGWTRNPLIEYYVQEYTSNGAGSAQGQKLGSFQVDGSTYDVWKHQQVNQPSIQGTATFWQYISNRVNKRPGSGTVNMAAHFEAWKKFGLNLGSHDYQVLATEGWGNAAGNSRYTISEVSNAGGSSNANSGGGGGGGGNQQQPSAKAVTSTVITTKTETKTVTSVSTVISSAPAVTKTEVKTQTVAGKAETVLKTETVVKTELVLVQTVPSCPASAASVPAPAVSTNVVSLA